MNWKVTKLKEVLKQYRIEHIVQNDTVYKQVTISKHNGVKFRGTKKGKDIGRKRQFLIDLKMYPNTIMLVRQGVYEGAIGLAPQEVHGCIATENMPMFSIENIEPFYLNLYIKSQYFRAELAKIPTTGTAQKSIHERQVLEIKIPVPDLTMQKRIIDNLNKISEVQKIISTEITHQQTLLTQLKQSILQDAISGKLTEQWRRTHSPFSPYFQGEMSAGQRGSGNINNIEDYDASILLKRIKVEKEKLIKEKKIKKEKPLPPIKPEDLPADKAGIPFELPEGWVWCRLGQITTLITDGKHGDCQNEDNSGYYFLSAKDIQNGILHYQNARQIIFNDFLETHRRTNLMAGDLCIVNTGATIGKTAIAPENKRTSRTTFQKSVAVIKTINEFVPTSYVEKVMITETKNLLKTSRGSAINNLLLGDMKKMIFALPPTKEQIKIIELIELFFDAAINLETQITQSQKDAGLLMQAVLKEAFENQ